VQARNDIELERFLAEKGIKAVKIGTVTSDEKITVTNGSDFFEYHVPLIRDTWFKTSYLLDQKQTKNNKATARFNNYKVQPLRFVFPTNFDGKRPVITSSQPRPKAAIIREKGSNS